MGNQKYLFTELSEHADKYVDSITSYLQFLVDGDGKTPHCPFTKGMMLKKQFYYDVSNSIISEEEFCSALDQMKLFIEMKSDRFAVAGVVYANSANFTLEVAEQAEKYRQKHRLYLIKNGLTTAWTHPRNSLGTHTNKDKPNDPLWVSEVPMLMVRSLDKGDEPFMVTPQSKEAFQLGIRLAESREKGGK